MSWHITSTDTQALTALQGTHAELILILKIEVMEYDGIYESAEGCRLVSSGSGESCWAPVINSESQDSLKDGEFFENGRNYSFIKDTLPCS
jgi:hypothetical protein